MATLEHAQELLETGKRKAGLKELCEVADDYRSRPAYYTPCETAELFIQLAYEIRFDRKSGMSYFGKKAAEAASLMGEAKTLLEASGERVDHPTWGHWYSVARRFALTDGDHLQAAAIVGDQIKALLASGDADPEAIERLRELKRRDENPPLARP